MPFRTEDLATAARRWMADAAPPAPAELQQLLEQATTDLRPRFRRRSEAEISAAVLAAWAEAEGKRTRCYVDLAASTPYLLVVVDPVAGARRTVPLADLVRILGPRFAS